jgi:phenylpyruvate tautomerase PptA (4-oxalocrotonate tautomerase family)
MPSAKIEIRRDYSPEDELRLMTGVHDAIVEAFKVNPVHRNVTLVVHPPHRFLGRTDCPDPERLTNIDIFVLPGRSLSAKRTLYRLLIQHLQTLEIPKECVLIRLHELKPENFGVRGGQPVCDVDLGYPLDV